MYFDPYRWIDQCILMIAQRYGYNRLNYDRYSRRWFMIYDFPLSEWWIQPSTALFITLPPVGNIQLHPPDGLYVEQGLRTINGLVPDHYIEVGEFNDLADQGWARLSVHIKSWCPSPDVVSGNNLLDVVDLVYHDLDRLAKQAEGVY
jgi:hypothetical protein